MTRTLFVFVFFALFGCSRTQIEKRVIVHPLSLTYDKIYDGDFVYDVVFDLTELNIDSIKTKSRKHFLKGIDLYKNQKRPSASIIHFKSSLLIYPDAKTYYELGNALLDIGSSYNISLEAIQAYEVAERIGFEPLSKLYFQKAIANYNIYRVQNEDNESHKWELLSNLRNSFEKGALDTLAISQHKTLKEIETWPEYKTLVLEIKSKNKDVNTLFNLYTNAFSNNLNNFKLEPEKIEMPEFRQSISYDFATYVPEMQNSSFGRDVSNDFYYVGRVKQSDIYHAVVYNSISFTYESMQPIYTYLAVYDTNGEIISKKMIGCQCSPEKIRTFSIKDNKIEVTDYRREWEQPYKDVGFENNSVKKYIELASVVLEIEDNGNIINNGNLDDSSDSTLFVRAK